MASSVVSVTHAVTGSLNQLPIGAVELFKSRPPDCFTTPAVFAGSVVVVGSFSWVPFALWLGWRRCKTRRSRIIYAVVVAVVLLYPARRWERVVRFWLWSKFVEYFSTQVVGDEAIPPASAGPVIYAVEPHGTFPFGLGIMSLGPLNKLFNRPRPVVASAVLRFPFFGNLIKSIGGVNASPKMVKQVIQAGDSVSVCPGGIAEMYWGVPRPGCLPNEEYVYLKARKGFVRLAMSQGVPVVPMYCFGNSHAMHKAKTPWILEALSRLLKTSLIIIWGRGFLPVPYRIPILYAVGRPLQLLHKQHPSQTELDAAHEQVIGALVDVFERYKWIYGWGHKRLHVV